MGIAQWLYVAPQRIRVSDLNYPQLSEWTAHEELNMQRLARVFAFKGCVGFVGSGASSCLGYPAWDALLPKTMSEGLRNRLLALLKKKLIDPTQAIEIAEQHLKDGQAQILQSLEHSFFIKEITKEREDRLTKAESEYGTSPFSALLNLPISRFATTNYDTELEKELARNGAKQWGASKSFEQDDLGKLVIFATALAGDNRQMVFHCHGILEKN